MGSVLNGVTQAVDDIVGTNMSGHNSASEAADAQRRAAADANATQRYMYDTTRADLAPYRDAGTSALSQLVNPDLQRSFTMNDYQQDPGYGLRLSEGMKAINSSAAARGMGNSGATMKALLKYGQDYASNEYNNAYTRFNNDRQMKYNMLSNIAGLGQGANAQQVNSNMNLANAMNENMMGAGNATAAAYMSNGGRLSNMVNSFLGSAGTAYGMSMGKKGV